MPHLNTIFAELLKHLPRHQFEKAVSARNGDRYVKRFTAWNQLTTLLYAQISRKESLREIETGLAAHGERLYHLGLKGIHRSTLADANNRRDAGMFETMFYALLQRCRDLTPKHRFKFKNPLHSIDATTIDLCLASFPWAKFRKTKGAIKLHCLYDHAGALPSFMVITDGKHHEARVVKNHRFPLTPDSIVSIDRGYMDFKWLYSLTENRVWFVTRAKDNLQYDVAGQHKKPKGKGVLKDEEISLAGFYAEEDYPDTLRRIEFHDEEQGKTLVFLTNNFTLAASTIAAIYKARWQIELFFKWIKQNLKIKSFLGTSKNAVMTQIWVAMCYYLLLAYIKYQTKYRNSLLELSRVIREMLMDGKSLIDVLSLKPEKLRQIKTEPIQAVLF
ncbi:MAG: IS4 family transposase [Rectinemataceae bacterium]|nr:IS4 family transposase [Rectinemataceae bacterium]